MHYIQFCHLDLHNKNKLSIYFNFIVQVFDLDTPSYQTNKDGPLLTKSAMAFYATNYLFGNGKTFMYVNGLPKDDMVKNYKPKLEYGYLELQGRV